MSPPSLVRALVAASALSLVLACAGPAPSVEAPAPAPLVETKPPRPAPSLVAESGGKANGAESTPQVAASSAEAAVPTGEPAANTPAQNPAGPEFAGGLLLGTVASQPVTAGDLIRTWHALAPREMWLVVDKLVATRLARAEAGRLGITLAPELLERAVAEEQRRLAAEVESAAPGVAVDDFLRGRLGVEPARYFADLREATLERLLTERVVRGWVLAQESRAVRILVVGADEVESVQAALFGGASFEALAREKSRDDTRERGGYVPYLVRTDGSGLARAAFDAQPGVVVGPLEKDDVRLFLRVEAVRPARTETWAILGTKVEESLAAEPLSDSEYVPWKLAVERQWPVDFAPLGDLVGASEGS